MAVLVKHAQQGGQVGEIFTLWVPQSCHIGEALK